MDNKYIEQLRTQVKDALRTDNMRYQHTLGVANTSACLAMCHGADMNKAYIAGLLHDCAKCVPDDVKIAECEQFGLRKGSCAGCCPEQRRTMTIRLMPRFR